MPATARSALVLALLSQTLNPSPRELLNAARPLQPAEVAAVLAASQQAVAGRSFHLSFGNGQSATDVVMGSGGRPRFVRTAGSIQGGTVSGIAGCSSPPCPTAPPQTRTEWRDDLIHMIEYTHQPARRCDGSPQSGDLIVEYEHRSSTNAWTARARATSAHPTLAPLFQMLSGAMTLASGERRPIDGRSARALVAPWTPPAAPIDLEIVTGDPLPNVKGGAPPGDGQQVLWVDTESLLPLRVEFTKRGMPAYGATFVYESIDIRPPAGVTPPQCIQN
jgi:hypothetical protein